MFRMLAGQIPSRPIGVALDASGGVTPPPPPPAGTGMKLVGFADNSQLQSLLGARQLDGTLWHSPNDSWENAAASAAVPPIAGKKYNITTLRTWLASVEAGYSPSNNSIVALHQRVVNGEFDAGITGQCNAIASHTPDCYLYIFHEFNGGWFSQYAGWSPTVWIQMFRHVAQLAKSINPRFKIVWAPSWNYIPNWASNTNAPTDLASYWPGDDVVDFAGLDWYCGGDDTPAARWNAAMTHSWGARAVADFGAAHGKTCVYPEWGLWGTDDPYWIEQSYYFFLETHAEAVCYFNIDASDGSHHLSHYPQSAAKYGQLFSQVPPVSETPVPPPTGAVGPLYVDGRILRYKSDGAPFLWIADTNWCCWRQSNSSYTSYLATRVAQKFSVIQAFVYVSNSYWPDYSRKSYDGSYPFNGGNPLSWNMNYWNILKARAQETSDSGLFFCLMCGCPGRSEEDWKLYGTTDAYNWGYMLGAHFRGIPGMMFGLTLDRHADYSDHWGIAEFRAEAEGIADGWNGAAQNFNGSADYSTVFITLHPNGDSRSTGAYWNTEPSNYMNAHQEWGRPDNIYGVAIGDYNRSPNRPSAMVEGIYESVDSNNDYGIYVSPLVINQQAMHNLFARAGVTYGYWLHWFDIWNGDQANAAGAWNMSRISNWVRSRPWYTWIPDQSIITSGEGSGTTRKVAVRNPDNLTWHVYFPNGSGSATLNLDKLGSGASVTGTWWNPSNDETQGAGTYSGSRSYSCPYSDGILTLTR